MVSLAGASVPMVSVTGRLIAWLPPLALIVSVCEPAVNGFRFAEGLKMFQDRVHCIPQAADDLKTTARKRLTWLDGQMDSKPFVAGSKLTMADILLFAFLDFMKGVGQPLDPANKNLTPWFERMKARPSAAA